MGGRDLRTSDDLLDMADECGSEREAGYRDGYRQGFASAVRALEQLWFLHRKGLTVEVLDGFVDAALTEWAAGDPSQMELPPSIAVRCTYCGKVATTLDHITPRVQGGDDSVANLTPACRFCNGSKNSRTPEEWRAGSPRTAVRRRGR